jgi:3-oxoacyl-[acyl-carrier protein] reductase
MPTRAQRRVIVTGGGTGIGRAIAQVFAADAAHVVLLGRRSQVLEQATYELQASNPNASIDWQPCDVSSVEDVERFVGWLAQAVGDPIDVLVNNAGGIEIIADDAPLAELAAYAQRVLASNVIGTYLMCRALSPHLRRPGGRIVNISSIAAVRGGGDMYSAAKAGVIGLTYSLAGDLAAEGITVNAVAPGFILETEFFGDRMTDEGKQRRVSQIPVGRPGRPADVAAAVHYLASEEASYVTGEVHHVNGGWVFGR